MAVYASFRRHPEGWGIWISGERLVRYVKANPKDASHRMAALIAHEYHHFLADCAVGYLELDTGRRIDETAAMGTPLWGRRGEGNAFAVAGDDDPLSEALANAYSHLVLGSLAANTSSLRKKLPNEWTATNLPGYRSGGKYLSASAFDVGERQLMSRAVFLTDMASSAPSVGGYPMGAGWRPSSMAREHHLDHVPIHLWISRDDAVALSDLMSATGDLAREVAAACVRLTTDRDAGARSLASTEAGVPGSTPVYAFERAGEDDTIIPTLYRGTADELERWDEHAACWRSLDIQAGARASDYACVLATVPASRQAEILSCNLSVSDAGWMAMPLDPQGRRLGLFVTKLSEHRQWQLLGSKSGRAAFRSTSEGVLIDFLVGGSCYAQDIRAAVITGTLRDPYPGQTHCQRDGAVYAYANSTHKGLRPGDSAVSTFRNTACGTYFATVSGAVVHIDRDWRACTPVHPPGDEAAWHALYSDGTSMWVSSSTGPQRVCSTGEETREAPE